MLPFALLLQPFHLCRAQPSTLNPQPASTNYALKLDGTNSFVELPPNIFTNLTEATVEGWVKWDAFSSYSRFFDFGKARQDISVNQDATRPNLRFEINTGPDQQAVVMASDALRLNEWIHIAAVFGRGGMKLYVNGELRDSSSVTNSFKEVANGEHNYLGRNNWKVLQPELNDDLKGHMDEVRVWSEERTIGQIRSNMVQRLSGREPGLVALWNFDRVEGATVKDSGPGLHDARLMGDARVVVGPQPGETRANPLKPGPSLAPTPRDLPPLDTTELSNRVLRLDGNGSFVVLPPDICSNLAEATVEGWVKWQTFSNRKRFFDFGEEGRSVSVQAWSENNSPTLVFTYDLEPGRWSFIYADNILVTNQWFHIAAVSSKDGMKLYVNGQLIASNRDPQNFARSTAGQHNYLGRSNWSVGQPGDDLTGELDEVRFWSVARTAEQIHANMFRRLKGDEPDLAGLWNFDDPVNPGRDSSRHQAHGDLYGQAKTVETPDPYAGGGPAFVHGTTVDVDGRDIPGPVEIIAELDGVPLQKLVPDQAGRYRLFVYETAVPVVFKLHKGELAASYTNSFRAGEERQWDLTLRLEASLAGHTLALDGLPLPAVVVQAVSTHNEARLGSIGTYYDLKRAVTNYPSLAATDEPMLVRVDPQVNFPLTQDPFYGTPLRENFFVRWTGRIRIAQAGRYTFHLNSDDGAQLFLNDRMVVDNGDLHGMFEKSSEVELAAGYADLRLDFCNARYSAGVILSWSGPGLPRQVVPEEVLVHSGPATVDTTMSNDKGEFHFGQLAPGFCRLRAQVPGGFVELDDGREVEVKRVASLRNLDFQFAPFKKGLWKHYTHVNGLADDRVQCSYQAADGAMWFGTANGVARFDGSRFVNWTKSDGLPDNSVLAITGDTNGVMWLGTGKGLVRHDAGNIRHPFTLFTTTNGLPDNVVTALERDRAGQLWVGTSRGLARFDGTNFVAFLASGVVRDSGPGRHDGKLIGNAKLVPAQRPTGPPGHLPLAEATTTPIQDTVLQLDGDGSYLETPSYRACS
jgi:hypothetical protein